MTWYITLYLAAALSTAYLIWDIGALKTTVRNAIVAAFAAVAWPIVVGSVAVWHLIDLLDQITSGGRHDE